MTQQVIVVTDDTPRADIIEALGWLNTTAKELRRKGYTGTASEAYARQHARIDALLDELVPSTCRTCGRASNHCTLLSPCCVVCSHR